MALAMQGIDQLPVARSCVLSEGRHQTREGDKVRFRVSDVFLPNSDEIFPAPKFDEQLEGVVISFSDSGTERAVFAVVEVVRRQTMVIPVKKAAIVVGAGSDNG